MAKTTTSRESKTATKTAAPAKAKAGQKAEAVTAKNEQASKIDNVLIVPESVTEAKVEDRSEIVASATTVAATAAPQRERDTEGHTKHSSPAVSDDDIAVMAYFLWEQEGYIHGRDGEYWFRAEELLRNKLASKLTKH